MKRKAGSLYKIAIAAAIVLVACGNTTPASENAGGDDNNKNTTEIVAEEGQQSVNNEDNEVNQVNDQEEAEIAGESEYLAVELADIHRLSELKSFLETFAWLDGYIDEGIVCYDSSNPLITGEGDAIIDHVAMSGGRCVDYSVYPVEQPGEVLDSDTKDPLAKFDFGYACFPQESVEWILANVLNCDEESITQMRQEWEDGNGWFGGYLQDGVYYTAAGGVGGAFEADIFHAESNGDTLRIIYDLSGTDGGQLEPLGTHEVVVSLKEYERAKYWSIYFDRRLNGDEIAEYGENSSVVDNTGANAEEFVGRYRYYSETDYVDNSTTYATYDNYIEFTREGDTYYVHDGWEDRALKYIGNNDFEYLDKSSEYDEEYVHYHFDEGSVTWYGNNSSCLYIKE